MPEAPSRTFEYRKITGEAVGPLSEEDLRSELARGAISHLTVARSSDDPAWRSLREVLALAAPAAVEPPPRRTAPRPAEAAGAAQGSPVPAPSPSLAEPSRSGLRSVAFVDLDPIMRVKRRLLLLPQAIETFWCVSILFTIPIVSFFLLFSSLASLQLLATPERDPLLLAALGGSAFLIFCLYVVVWIVPLLLVAAMKQDADWALLVVTIAGLAGSAAIVFVSGQPLGLLAIVGLIFAACMTLNSGAHLAFLFKARRDPVYRSMFVATRRGSSNRPAVGAVFGAGWDLLLGLCSIALVGCIVVVAMKAAGPFALLFYVFALAVIRRPVAQRLVAAIERARDRLQRSVDRRFEADVENPILFLRSFSDDVIRTEAFGTRVMSAVFGVDLAATRLEESIAVAVRKAGPLIAIARPGLKRATLGAARQRLTDEEWQSVVSTYIGRAVCIVLVQGRTQGLGWELAEIRRQGMTRKLIMIVPPDKGAGMEEVVRAWTGDPGAAVPKDFIGRAPPLAVIEGPSEHAIEVCIASRLDAAAYRRSAHFCLNKILQRGPRSARADGGSPSDEPA